MSKLVPCASYTTSQLKDALASLATKEVSKRIDDCSHIHGFFIDSSSGSADGDCSSSSLPFFKDDHELSMLQTITARRVLDYSNLLTKPETPTEKDLLEKASQFHSTHGPILNLLQTIRRQSPSMALAAEFKRASPSKGDIAPHVKVDEQAVTYTQAGACTISVLTEEHYFRGSLADLTSARVATTTYTNECNSINSRPAILRKDFCISKYMIAEAFAAGADTILLIVAITPKALLAELISYARSLGMEPLVEVHAEVELDVALEAGGRVIGVNNRNLHTFQMDLATTDRTADELTKRGCDFFHRYKNNGADDGHDTNGGNSDDAGYALCALSGMSSAGDVDRYRRRGVGMCLIGESLMRAADPKAAIQSLCLNPSDYDKLQLESSSASCSAYTGGTKIIKVCGVTNADDALVACQNGANLIGVIFVPKSKRCVSFDQAKEVVGAVRSFGERSGRLSVPTNVFDCEGSTSPLQDLVRKARAMEEVTRRPLVVGVFQNQDHEYIRQAVDECGLDLVQLHGKEGMEAANMKKCGVPAIRVVDVETNEDGSGSASDAVEKLLGAITTDPFAILLDTSIKGSKDGGGTGVTFDWGIAEKLQNHGMPVIIAGGLKPSNIEDAVKNVRPWGVDVSSGVEERPGKKDHNSVATFVQGAREAAVEASKGF